MSDQYVAAAVDHRGMVKGAFKSPTVRGAMALADAGAPNKEVMIDVRGNFTDDGTYWGEGGGQVMATREWGKWRAYSYAPIQQPKPGQLPWARSPRSTPSDEPLEWEKMWAGAKKKAAKKEEVMAKWDIHIFNPRNQTTSTKRGVAVPGTESSMAYARAVIMWASAKYGKAQKYILAVPHRK